MFVVLLADTLLDRSCSECWSVNRENTGTSRISDHNAVIYSTYINPLTSTHTIHILLYCVLQHNNPGSHLRWTPQHWRCSV